MLRNRSFEIASAAAIALSLIAGTASAHTPDGTAPASAPASKPAAEAKAEVKVDMSKYKKETIPVAPKVTPQHVTVQHILIAFDGSLPGRPISRTKEEAKNLAHEILEMARMGSDFDTLCVQWTNDSAPGIYSMANKGVPPKEGEFQRDKMVAAFGDVGFAISPGNIDIAEFDPKTSPYGWHIIKRLK